MTDQQQDRPNPLRSTLAYLERESARRAKGSHPGMMRLDDAELAALLALLRREVGAGSSVNTSSGFGISGGAEPTEGPEGVSP